MKHLTIAIYDDTTNKFIEGDKLEDFIEGFINIDGNLITISCGRDFEIIKVKEEDNYGK